MRESLAFCRAVSCRHLPSDLVNRPGEPAWDADRSPARCGPLGWVKVYGPGYPAGRDHPRAVAGTTGRCGRGAVMTLGEKIEQAITRRPDSHVPGGREGLDRLTGTPERPGEQLRHTPGPCARRRRASVVVGQGTRGPRRPGVPASAADPAHRRGDRPGASAPRRRVRGLELGHGAAGGAGRPDPGHRSQGHGQGRPTDSRCIHRKGRRTVHCAPGCLRPRSSGRPETPSTGRQPTRPSPCGNDPVADAQMATWASAGVLASAGRLLSGRFRRRHPRYHVRRWSGLPRWRPGRAAGRSRQ